MGKPEPPRFVPDDYDAAHELMFVTGIAAALVRLPEAICYFNPGGECVRGGSLFLNRLSGCASIGELPFPVWSNVRFFQVPNTDPVWNLMDTVGMVQLGAPDHEAFFLSSGYKPSDVDEFLRTMSSYVAINGPVIHGGDTTDDPVP